MQLVIVLASLALVGSIGQVLGADDLMVSLGITDAELKTRLAMVSEIQKLRIWVDANAIQRERLRQAVILDKEPPALFNGLTSYDKILEADNADFWWKLTNLEPIARALFLHALPKVPHEDNVEAASKKRWWRNLNEFERRDLSTLILTEKLVPAGFDNWRDAIEDVNIGDWIQNFKPNLKPVELPATATLQQVLGITDKELMQRQELVAKIEKMEIWDHLSAVQQQRLRQAVLLDKERPFLWNFLTSYDGIIDARNANLWWRMTHWEPLVRDLVMNALPRVPHEDVLRAAEGKPWWDKNFTPEEKKTVSTLILTEKNVPQGWDNWRAAVKDVTLADWVVSNKARLLA